MTDHRVQHLSRKVRRVLVSGSFALAVSGVSAAQNPAPSVPAAPPASASGRPMHAMSSGMHHDRSMMALMAATPHALLARHTALELTEAQVASLQILDRRMSASRDSAMNAMMPLHDKIEQTIDTAVDASAVRDITDQMGALHSLMMTSVLQAIHDARALLTTDQRRRLATLPAMHMKGGDSGCGM